MDELVNESPWLGGSQTRVCDEGDRPVGEDIFSEGHPASVSYPIRPQGHYSSAGPHHNDTRKFAISFDCTISCSWQRDRFVLERDSHRTRRRRKAITVMSPFLPGTSHKSSWLLLLELGLLL